MKLALVTETLPPEINGVAMTFGDIAQFEAGLMEVAGMARLAPPGAPAERERIARAAPA